MNQIWLELVRQQSKFFLESHLVLATSMNSLSRLFMGLSLVIFFLQELLISFGFFFPLVIFSWVFLTLQVLEISR
jgi:hypothetical protein